MATNLPQIAVKAAAGGWLASCSNAPGCSWELWNRARPVVEQQAHQHRAWHVKRSQP